MSARPVNHAAPPPTAGPFSARMKTFLWSIIERIISSAESTVSSVEFPNCVGEELTWSKARQERELFFCRIGELR